MDVLIRSAAGPGEMAQLRALFVEYAAWLKVDLCFQDFDEELATLPGAYAPPRGRLLLAQAQEELAGCIGLRPLSAATGEVKRLYVRPAFRRRGIAELLAVEIVEAARAMGYARLRLDTLAFMHEAAALYRKLGFVEIAPYYQNPLQGVVYMELLL